MSMRATTFAKVAFILGGRTATRAAHVAEVVERQSRHHRVEVNDTNALTGGIVEHHVVQLGVVVRDAFRHPAARLQVEQHVHHRFVAQAEIDLPLHRGGAIARVFLDGRAQSVEPPAAVMKVRNRFVQSWRRQVGQLPLKQAKSLRSFASLGGLR